MTYDQFIAAFVAGFWEASLATIIAVFQIAPPVIITILVVSIYARLMKVRDAGENVVLHGSAFGFIGLIVAYLYVGKNESSVVAGLLPHFIAAVALAFQLIGRLKTGWKVPIESQSTVAAAAATAFCFLFGSIYFESIRPTSEEEAVTSDRITSVPQKPGQSSDLPGESSDLGQDGIEEILKETSQ